MKETSDMDEHIGNLLNNNQDIIIVEKKVSPVEVSKHAPEEYMLKTTQYIVAPKKSSDSSDYLQKLLNSLIPDTKSEGGNEFSENEKIIYCGDIYFQQKIAHFDSEKGLVLLNSSFSDKIKPSDSYKSFDGDLYQEIIISMYPAVKIAEEVIAKKIPKDFWNDETYIHPLEIFVPPDIPIEKDIIRKL